MNKLSHILSVNDTTTCQLGVLDNPDDSLRVVRVKVIEVQQRFQVDHYLVKVANESVVLVATCNQTDLTDAELNAETLLTFIDLEHEDGTAYTGEDIARYMGFTNDSVTQL